MLEDYLGWETESAESSSDEDNDDQKPRPLQYSSSKPKHSTLELPKPRNCSRRGSGTSQPGVTLGIFQVSNTNTHSAESRRTQMLHRSMYQLVEQTVRAEYGQYSRANQRVCSW